MRIMGGKPTPVLWVFPFWAAGLYFGHLLINDLLASNQALTPPVLVAMHQRLAILHAAVLLLLFWSQVKIPAKSGFVFLGGSFIKIPVVVALFWPWLNPVTDLSRLLVLHLMPAYFSYLAFELWSFFRLRAMQKERQPPLG
jgi:hypothetical protein